MLRPENPTSIPLEISPHVRGVIVRKLAAAGKWQGSRTCETVSRAGSIPVPLRLRLTLSPQANMDGERIHWQVWITGAKPRTLRGGSGGTVADCFERIQKAIPAMLAGERSL